MAVPLASVVATASARESGGSALRVALYGFYWRLVGVRARGSTAETSRTHALTPPAPPADKLAEERGLGAAMPRARAAARRLRRRLRWLQRHSPPINRCTSPNCLTSNCLTESTSWQIHLSTSASETLAPPPEHNTKVTRRSLATHPMAPTFPVNMATATLSVLLFLQSAIVSAEEFEWGGTFDVPDTDYAWTMQIVDGEWADPSMKLAILPTSGTAESDLEAVEGTATVSLNGLPALLLFCS